MTRDFNHYTWSLRTLDRRLRFFNIFRHDKNVTIDAVKNAVRKECNGPGQLLGYRALQLKIRQIHGLNVPRDLVYAAMTDVSPEGLANRLPRFKEKRKKGRFSSVGPNWVFSFDGHDKLMGYQNHTFPLAIYGCIDTASRKLMFLKVWPSNSKPEQVGRWYFDYLYESRRLPHFVRID